MSKIIGFKFEPIDNCIGLIEIYEEDRSVVARVRYDETGKPLSIIDISIVLDKEEKLFFKESINELLQNEYSRKYLFDAIYDAVGICVE